MKFLCVGHVFIKCHDFVFFHLLSSSDMLTVASCTDPTSTRLGSEEALILNPKVSSYSKMLSSIIITSNWYLVIPGVNVTVYGPEVKSTPSK